MQKRLYRVTELSNMLSIGKSTIWAWVKEGRFPKPIQISSRMTVWTEDDLQCWLNEKDQANEK
jgi:prophage regulatory protein